MAILGTDIAINLIEGDVVYDNDSDFATVSEEDNLKQAISNRILCKKDDLFSHANYGSDLYKLIGSAVTDNVLNTAGTYVYQALADEPRIDAINSIEVDFRIIDDNPTLVIYIDVTPIGSDVSLNLVINYDIS